MLVGDAGEGVCEVVITDPNGNMVPSQLVDSGQGFLQLFYKPVTYGQHKATVLFNDKFVPGMLLGLWFCCSYCGDYGGSCGDYGGCCCFCCVCCFCGG